MKSRLVVVPLGIVAAFAVALACWPPGDGADVASWVQAFGGLLAVWGAFELGSAQSDAAEEARRATKAEAAAQVKWIVEQVSSDVLAHVTYLRNWPSGAELKLTPAALLECLPAIDSCLSLPMPEDCSRSLLEVRSACSGLASLMRVQAGAFIAGHTRVSMAIDLAELKCERARKRLGIPIEGSDVDEYVEELKRRNAKFKSAVEGADI